MNPYQTAIHEAGHAVVAYVLGLAFYEIALTHEEAAKTGDLGFVVHPNPAYGYEHGSLGQRQKTLRDQAVATCAGLAAEHVFFGIPLSIEDEHAQADFRQVIEYEREGLKIPGKRGGLVGDDATWSYIEILLAKATRLVKRHRKAIERLANVLMEKKRLDGKVAEQLQNQWIRPMR